MGRTFYLTIPPVQHDDVDSVDKFGIDIWKKVMYHCPSYHGQHQFDTFNKRKVAR